MKSLVKYCILAALTIVFSAAFDGVALAADVTTQAVTNISYTTAVGHAEVLNPSHVTAYGVCWSTAGEPPPADNCTDEFDDTITQNFEFTSKMTGLSPGTTYFVRAYAREKVWYWEWTYYGDTVQFNTLNPLPLVTTQPVTDIKAKSATGHGTIVSPGMSSPTQYGVCWNTEGSPSIHDNKKEGEVDNDDDDDAYEFASEITGLKSNTTYHVRAYATNDQGTAYGNEVTFSTSSSPPAVSTQAASGIGFNTAIANGTILDVGTPDPTQHGFCWNTSGMPDLEGPKTQNGPVHAAGPFSSALNDLLPHTTYYVRAYASNEAGTAYGDEVSFKTLSVLPAVSTGTVTDIATHSAVGHGAILDLGVPDPFQHGLCWNTFGSPGLEDRKTEKGPVSDTGEFSSVLEDLLPETTYYVRAYAGNAAGTLYGNEVTFTTVSSSSAPVATLTDPPVKITNATSYALRVAGIGVVGYRYSLDAGAWSGERPVSEAIVFELFEEGGHTLSVAGKNQAEMWQSFDAPTLLTWHIDTTPPLAELFNYPAGICNASAAEVTVGGFDVVSYRYRLDAGDWSGILPVQRPVNLSLLSEGEHVLEVIGADNAGNWQEENLAAKATWTHDPAVPTAVLTPVPEGRTSRTAAAVTVTFPDNGIPIDAYTYTTDDGHTWWKNDAQDAIELTGLSEGRHRLCVHGFGNGVWQDGLDGMSSTDSATCVQWRVDLTPANPAVLSVEADPSAAAPSDGMPGTVSARLTWTWDSDDEMETIQRYRIWYAEEDITEANLDGAVEVFCDLLPGVEGFEEGYTVSGLIPGRSYYFGLKSIDSAGNLSGLSNIAFWAPEDRLPRIAALQLTQGGVAADNATPHALGITGDNFLGTADCNVVRFESASCLVDVAAKSGTAAAIFANIPVGMPPGAYRVRVINRNGVSKASAAVLSISAAATPVPVVTGIRPSIAEIGVPTAVTISGANFDPELSAVNLLAADGAQTPLSQVTWQDPQTLTAVVDVPQNFPEGSYHVQVVDSNGSFNEVSALKLELCNPLALEDGGGAAATAGILRIGKNAIPAATLLTTDDRNEVTPVGSHRSRVKIYLEAGSAFESAGPEQTVWTDFTGSIRPPRQVQTPGPVADTLGTDAVSLSMGIDDDLRLQNGKTMFVLMESTLPNDLEDPVVYHVSAEDELSLAGVAGEWRGLAIREGGSVLSKRPDTPEAGLNTYTFGLLLASMSEYAIGPNLFEEADTSFEGNDDPYDACFIKALGFENTMILHGIIIFVIIGLALFIYFKRQCR